MVYPTYHLVEAEVARGEEVSLLPSLRVHGHIHPNKREMQASTDDL